MESIGLGEGLAVLGFWMFVAAVVVGGIWNNIRKRDTEHETLRRLLESEQPVDESLIDKVLGAERASIGPDLQVAAMVQFFLAPGMLLLGWGLGILKVLSGVAGLILLLGIGLWFAGRMINRKEAGPSA